MTTGTETLSYVQYATLVVTATISACLSIIGSSLMLYMARGKFKTQIYHRILFGLSLCCIVFAVGIILQSYLIPANTPGLPWAVGTQSTCSLAGFVTTWGALGVSFYNAILSIFFWLLVRDSKKRRTKNYEQMLMWWFEIPSHILTIMTITGLCLVGVATQSFNKGALLGACVFAAYPAGCENDPNVDCQWGEMGPALMRVRVFLVISVSFISFGFILMVYWAVKKQLNRSIRISFHASMNQDRKRQIEQVRYQALWYGLIYFNFMVWPLVNEMVNRFVPSAKDQTGEPQFFVLVLVMYMLIPMQGVFSFLVYIRPKYNQWRAAEPAASSYFIVGSIVTGENLDEYRKSRRILAHPQSTNSQQKQTTNRDESGGTTIPSAGGQSSILASSAGPSKAFSVVLLEDTDEFAACQKEPAFKPWTIGMGNAAEGSEDPHDQLHRLSTDSPKVHHYDATESNPRPEHDLLPSLHQAQILELEQRVQPLERQDRHPSVCFEKLASEEHDDARMDLVNGAAPSGEEIEV